MSKRTVAILNILVLLISCKPKGSIFIQKSIADLDDREIEQLILKRNDDLKTLKLNRVNFNVNINGEELKSGGTVGIIKDSVMIISLVPAFGYEISRIFCYKDKILILDRIEKTYFYTSLEKSLIKYKIKGDYSDIEALLIGNAFIYGDKEKRTNMEKGMERGTDKLKLDYNILDKEKIYSSQEIVVRKDSLVIESNNIKDRKDNVYINVKYDKFILIDEFILPEKIMLSVNSPDSKLNLEIEIGNIIINEKINSENTIPAKYEEAIMDY